MANTALITGSYGGLETCFTNIHAKKGGDLVLVGRSSTDDMRRKEEISIRG